MFLNVCRTFDLGRMKLSYKRFFLDKMPDQRPQTKLFGAVSLLGVSLLYQTPTDLHTKTGSGKHPKDQYHNKGKDHAKGAADDIESLDNKDILLFLRLSFLSLKRGRFSLYSNVQRSRDYCYSYFIGLSHFVAEIPKYMGNEAWSSLGKIVGPNHNFRLRSRWAQARRSDFLNIE